MTLKDIYTIYLILKVGLKIRRSEKSPRKSKVDP